MKNKLLIVISLFAFSSRAGLVDIAYEIISRPIVRLPARPTAWHSTGLLIERHITNSAQDLIDAVIADDAQAVKAALANYKGDIDSLSDNEDQPLLSLAALRGSTKIVRLLLAKGANPNITGYFNMRPLMAAAQGGHIRVVQILLENGAQIDAKDEYGGTALIYALGQPLVLAFLLAYGADVNVPDNEGKTPLIYACYKDDGDDAVALLLKHGASPVGSQTLIDAIFKRPLSPDTIVRLLKAGANANTQDGNGRTALHYSVLNNAIYATVILSKFTDLSIEDNDGYTALDLTATNPALRAYFPGNPNSSL